MAWTIIHMNLLMFPQWRFHPGLEEASTHPHYERKKCMPNAFKRGGNNLKNTHLELLIPHKLTSATVPFSSLKICFPLSQCCLNLSVTSKRLYLLAQASPWRCILPKITQEKAKSNFEPCQKGVLLRVLSANSHDAVCFGSMWFNWGHIIAHETYQGWLTVC